MSTHNTDVAFTQRGTDMYMPEEEEQAYVSLQKDAKQRDAKRRRIAGWAIATAIASTLAAGSAALAQEVFHRANYAQLLASFKRPNTTPAPADNATTAAKVELGKQLFFDPRLSGQGSISCGTCHNPALGWQDGLAKGVGFKGGQLGRRTPTILNSAWAQPLFWDGRAATLEAQAKGPLASEAEMNMPHDLVVKTVAAVPGYVAEFNQAFPGEPIGIDQVAKAMAAYERTVVSGQAPFDRFVDGDNHALSDSAKRGFVVFNGKAGCVGCHSGWRFTDDGFHDIGLSDDDAGRGKLMPKVAVLQHAFKTPTLRNIAERAPYMHDGSLPTLAAVIDHYDHGFVARPSLSPQVHALNLSFQERADLEAFMRSLTSKDEAVNLPALPR